MLHLNGCKHWVSTSTFMKRESVNVLVKEYIICHLVKRIQSWSNQDFRFSCQLSRNTGASLTSWLIWCVSNLLKSSLWDVQRSTGPVFQQINCKEMKGWREKLRWKENEDAYWTFNLDNIQLYCSGWFKRVTKCKRTQGSGFFGESKYFWWT